MEWEIEYLEQQGIVRVTTSGRIALEPLVEMAAEALALGAEHGARRFLVDHRKSVPDMETLAIYNLPQTLMTLGVSSEHRIATLYSEQLGGQEDFRFFDDLAYVNKFVHHLFVDYEAAVDWLMAG